MNAIDPGGAVAKDGRMAVGDQIVMVRMQRPAFKATIRAETSLWIYFTQSEIIRTWVYNFEHPLHIYERKILEVALTVCNINSTCKTGKFQKPFLVLLFEDINC